MLRPADQREPTCPVNVDSSAERHQDRWRHFPDDLRLSSKPTRRENSLNAPDGELHVPLPGQEVTIAQANSGESIGGEHVDRIGLNPFSKDGDQAAYVAALILPPEGLPPDLDGIFEEEKKLVWSRIEGDQIACTR